MIYYILEGEIYTGPSLIVFSKLIDGKYFIAQRPLVLP